MDIGTRLRKLIKERGLKQRWVAEKSGVNEMTLQRILDNRHSPNAANIVRIAEALGVSTDWLLGLSDRAS